MFASRQLEDIYYPTGETALIKDYDIQSGSTILILYRLLGGLQLKIKYDTTEKTIEIKNDASVSDLKDLLKSRKEFP